MPYLSITRLKLKSLYYLVPFSIHTEQIVSQIRASPGFLQGKLLGTLDLSMRTATLWASAAEMRSFHQQGAHRQVMGKLDAWSSEAAAGHQVVTGDTFPSWGEMNQWLRTTGNFFPLSQPSQHHRDRIIPTPKWIIFQHQIFPSASPSAKRSEG